MATFTLNSLAPANELAMTASFANYCFCCGRKLGKKVFYFEVNTAWQLIIPGSDDANSQGCFPIGSTCKNKFEDGLLIQKGQVK